VWRLTRRRASSVRVRAGGQIFSSRQAYTSWRSVFWTYQPSFAEPVVVDAQMVGDLVDDGTVDLASNLLLAAAGRLPVDGDSRAGLPRTATCDWSADALVKPVRCSTVAATLPLAGRAPQETRPAPRRPFLRSGRFDPDHQPIVQRSAAVRVSPGAVPQADPGPAPQPPQQRGPVQHRRGDQSPGPGPDQLSRRLTAASCASWHDALTSIWAGGLCTSSSDSTASTPKRWPAKSASVQARPVPHWQLIAFTEGRTAGAG
jgi:hypothetical protein